jgi:hypothetical protein
LAILSLVDLAPAVAYDVSTTYAGLQFIFYNGTISGSIKHPHIEQSRCGDDGVYYFSNLANVSLRVGVTPPWDLNPFYLELSRVGIQGDPLGSEPTWTSRESGYDHCYNYWGAYWHEVIYDLGFATTRYVCRDGYPCAAELALSS